MKVVQSNKHSSLNLFIAIVLIVVVGTACGGGGDTAPNTTVTLSPTPTQPIQVHIDVSAADAKRMIDTDEDVIILDVRTQEEHESAHIDKAILIPLSEMETRVNDLDREKKIIAYCRSGVRSRNASMILTKLGFRSVYNMMGGISAWIAAEYPVIASAGE